MPVSNSLWLVTLCDIYNCRLQSGWLDWWLCCYEPKKNLFRWLYTYIQYSVFIWNAFWGWWKHLKQTMDSIRKLMGGAGEIRKKYSHKGKLNEKNLCTPINPKKYSCYGLKKKIIKDLVLFSQRESNWLSSGCFCE